MGCKPIGVQSGSLYIALVGYYRQKSRNNGPNDEIRRLWGPIVDNRLKSISCTWES